MGDYKPLALKPTSRQLGAREREYGELIGRHKTVHEKLKLGIRMQREALMELECVTGQLIRMAQAEVKAGNDSAAFGVDVTKSHTRGS